MNNTFKLFKQIIRESNYDNTYKMAWAKSLVEISTEIDLKEDNIEIELSTIAKKFIKYYWNQTIFFDLRQGSNPLKNPTIISVVKELIDNYFKLNDNSMPVLYEKAETKFDSIGLIDYYNKTISKVVTVLKQDVSWRFIILNGVPHREIYKYEKGDNSLIICSKILTLLKEDEQDLYDLINYRWGLILETFNSIPKINKKVKIMDEREIKRNSLNKYKYYLDLENPTHQCFVCNKIIKDEELSIDHIIPWSYIYSDDIWNLVYVCKHCNSQKSNIIPKQQEISKLKNRNIQLLQILNKEKINNIIVNELENAIEHDYVDKFWIGSKN